MDWIVHCRIGSLEMDDDFQAQFIGVHCRIGSLEKNISKLTDTNKVHCRIGSLETLLSLRSVLPGCSLPHRQFRNIWMRFLL